MEHLHLVRSYLPKKTVGFIDVGDIRLRSLELPDKKNKQNISCIPEGAYIVEPDDTGRHKFYRITRVPERTFIEIHAATTPEDLLGCISFGRAHNSNYDLLDSFEAVSWFKSRIGNNAFKLTIRAYDANFDTWDR